LLGIAAAVITFLVTVAAFGLQFADFRDDTAPAPNPSRLSIVDFSVVAKSDIEAEFDDAERDLEGQAAAVQASAIDITMRNDGDLPALITGVDVRFLHAEQIEQCTEIGGPVSVSGAYDIRVPTGPNMPKAPFQMRHPVTFQVEPRSVDRLALTIGPDTFREGQTPYLYVAEVSLEVDGQEDLVPTGAAALLEPPSGPANFLEVAAYGAPSGIDPDVTCAQRATERMESALESGAEPSPELVDFQQAIAQMPANPPPPSPELGETQDVDWLAHVENLDCSATGGEYELLDVRYHARPESDVPDAFVSVSCATESGGAPLHLQMFNGGSNPADPWLDAILVDGNDLSQSPWGFRFYDLTFDGPEVILELAAFSSAEVAPCCPDILVRQTYTYSDSGGLEPGEVSVTSLS
jgi:hypothetical protein